jgi:glycyl-tRNA synthetase beta chain
VNDRQTQSEAAADLLIELGCEELPPKSLDELREAFFDGVASGLEQLGLSYETAGSRAFSTPRRLAVLFRQVAACQTDRVEERRGPAVSAAFDETGEPTPAALGFARSVGLDIDQLERMENERGEWLLARIQQAGQSLDELLFPLLEQTLRQLPVARPMRWAAHDFSFVRPVHWLVVLHGQRVLEGSLFAQSAGRITRGHRVHSPGPHDLRAAADYEEALLRAHVVANPAQRQVQIREALTAADPNVLIDEGLLREVTNLVEWPVAVECRFEEEFLQVPHEALIASMQDHQRFFPVADPDNEDRVSSRFVAIANLESTDVGAVREGYERVIRPRLADARFFLEQDEKRPLDAYLPALERAVFQKNIGTVGDKSKRMAAISEKLAEVLGVDPTPSARAARLSKCDLMTQMVGEFPELQGLMGRHYALRSGESDEVATAIGEHYAPAYAGDGIPRSSAGQIVSIADRADTLVGIFASGLRPSGNKDPFALRRAALGLVRILLEAEIDLPLNRLLALAANELSSQVEVGPDLLVDVREFIVDRLHHYYRDQGFATELTNSAVASGWDSLPDLDQRLRALDHFMGQAAAASLAASNKRIGNILRKSGQDFSSQIDEDRLILDQEKCLFGEVTELEREIEPLLRDRDYSRSLVSLSRLKEPVDDFFDTVMVMDEDPALRSNRLALLARLKALFDRIADLSVLG